jgi:hypothetical protein
MYRRPSLAKLTLLRAPSLVDAPPQASRRPSFKGERSFKVPEHPDDLSKEQNNNHGSASNIAHLLSPRRFSAGFYDPDLSNTMLSEDDDRHVFSTEETPVVTSKTKTNKQRSHSQRRCKSMSKEEGKTSSSTGRRKSSRKRKPMKIKQAHALTEDAWSQITKAAPPSNGTRKTRGSRRVSAIAETKSASGESKNCNSDKTCVQEETIVSTAHDEVKCHPPPAAFASPTTVTTVEAPVLVSAPALRNVTAAGSILRVPPEAPMPSHNKKASAPRALFKSMRRMCHKMDEWLSYQSFLCRQRCSRNHNDHDGGHGGDYDGLESVHSNFTWNSRALAGHKLNSSGAANGNSNQ